MATNQDSQMIEEALKKTDLGQTINENKRVIILFAAVLVIGIIIYSYFSHSQDQKRYEALDTVFTIEKEVFTPYLEDKKKPIEFKAALAKIDDDVVSHPNLIPSFLETVNKLDQNSQIDDAVLTIFSNWLAKIKKSNPLYIFMAIRYAGLNEDAKDLNKAINALEKAKSAKSEFLKDRLYFELGRLYHDKGDKKKSQESFDYVLKNFKTSNYAELATIFMGGVL